MRAPISQSRTTHPPHLSKAHKTFAALLRVFEYLLIAWLFATGDERRGDAGGGGGGPFMGWLGGGLGLMPGVAWALAALTHHINLMGGACLMDLRANADAPTTPCRLDRAMHPATHPTTALGNGICNQLHRVAPHEDCYIRGRVGQHTRRAIACRKVHSAAMAHSSSRCIYNKLHLHPPWWRSGSRMLDTKRNDFAMHKSDQPRLATIRDDLETLT